MVKVIIGAILVAALGSAYIFSFRLNNKDSKGGHCDSCAFKKCSGCEFKKK